MSNTFNDEIIKRYYHIGEVARMLGVSCSAIRYWLNEFDVVISQNRWGRKFTAEEVAMVTEIHRLLKIEGYKMEFAKKRFKAAKIERYATI